MKACCTCKWWHKESDEYCQVCVNDESESCADYTEPDDYCDKWEAKK